MASALSFKVLFCSSLSVFAFTPESVSAQDSPSAPPAGVDRQVERLQEKAQQDYEKRADEFEAERRVAPRGGLPVEGEKAPAVSGECVAVRAVDIAGMTLFARSDFQAELNALIGPCVGLGEIDALLRRITNRYIENGYVTSRAVIAPQDLADGTLEIVVFEGELSEVKPAEAGADGERGPVQDSELAFAMPGLAGRVLNLRDIEQGIDQISRLPSLEATIDIEPGAAQATSNLIVNSKRKLPALRPVVDFNNDGQTNTGRLVWNAALSADNLLGALDGWNIYYSSNLMPPDGASFRSWGGFFSVPFGYWTLSLGGGKYSYDSVIRGNGTEFASDGDSWNGSATLDRMLYRDSDSKVGFSAGLNVSDSVNRIRGIRLSASSYRLTTLTLRFRLQQKMGTGLLQGSAGIVRGLKFLGAESADFGPQGPQLDFHKLVGDLAYLQPLDLWGAKSRYSFQMRAQKALDPVLPAQRFSLGGSSTVRGFRDDGISGGSGMFFRQQLATEIKAFPSGKSGANKAVLRGFAGFDSGLIFPRDDDPFTRGYLMSGTLGLGVESQMVGLSAEVSMPWAAPDFVAHKRLEFLIAARLGF